MLQPFRRSVFYVLIMTYAVILAGSIVRGTDAGLGCPDLPKCFGNWVPPVHISELPENYKDLYQVNGRIIADFDAVKTWTEYINRLLGALLGLMILGLFLKSFKYKKYESDLPWYCFGLLVLVIIQGGVGAFVVSTHLQPWLVSIHMVLALLMIYFTQSLHHYLFELDHQGVRFQNNTHQLFWTKLLLFLGFIQIFLGTRVRESVDHFLNTPGNLRENVMGNMDYMFFIHRSFSLFFILILIISLVKIYQQDLTGSSFKRGIFILLLVGINVFSGAMLSYAGFPKHYQPPHLFFGVLILGSLFKQYLVQKKSLL